MPSSVDQALVVWVSPEVIGQEKRAEVVKRHRGDAEALIEKLDNLDREVTGEYRILTENPDDPNVGSAPHVETNVAYPVYEDSLAVYIDDAPDDPDDGSGHYEVYDASTHGEPYTPIPSRRGMPAEEAPRVSEDNNG